MLINYFLFLNFKTWLQFPSEHMHGRSRGKFPPSTEQKSINGMNLVQKTLQSRDARACLAPGLDMVGEQSQAQEVWSGK